MRKKEKKKKKKGGGIGLLSTCLARGSRAGPYGEQSKLSAPAAKHARTQGGACVCDKTLGMNREEIVKIRERRMERRAMMD